MKKMIPLLVILLVSLTACIPGGNTPATDTANPDAQDGPQNPPADQPAAGPAALPPEPLEIAFQASDGQPLTGRYYPAAVNPAPVIVLMHWVMGDMSDWNEIAVWLQNRGQANPFPNPGDSPWWDPAWFPAPPASASYGVFISSFRGCEPANTGCPNWTPDVWLLDAQAAMLKASELEGVDPVKIAAIGSSIGADGAIDGCAFLNEQKPGSCQGALSLSPGSYLNLPYIEAAGFPGHSPTASGCLVPGRRK